MNAPRLPSPAPQGGDSPETGEGHDTNPLLLGLAWMLAGKVIRQAKQRAAYFPLGAGGDLGGSSL